VSAREVGAVGSRLLAHDANNSGLAGGRQEDFVARCCFLVAERAPEAEPVAARIDREQPAAGSTAEQVPAGKIRVVGAGLVTNDARNGTRGRLPFSHGKFEPRGNIHPLVASRDVHRKLSIIAKHPKGLGALLGQELNDI
jgi:hypothetical protein